MLWNSIDSVLAQAFITIHHILLQTFAGAEFHGIFASAISIIYTFIPIFNLGFDYSLSIYLKKFTQTKKNFISILTIQFLPQLFLICLIAHLLSHYFPNSQISPEAISWLKYIFIIEYIRKSSRSFLQLMLDSKITASVEILGTLFYMFLFWLLVLLFQVKLTIILGLKLLALSVILQAFILLIRIFHIFSKLDSKIDDTNTHLITMHQDIAKTRIGIWLNHIASQVNYSNFVIPFSNACFGSAQASLLSVLMNSARCVTLFFQKGLGISSLALLSQANNNQNTSKNSKHSDPIYYLYNLSAPLIIFFLLNASKLSYLFSNNTIVWHLASLACFLSIIEGALSVYEKFYITEKKIYLFSITNSLGSIILFGLTYKFLIFNSLIQFFLCFFLVRVTSLLAIILTSHHLLKIPSIPYLNSYMLATATFFSILFYLLF